MADIRCIPYVRWHEKNPHLAKRQADDLRRQCGLILLRNMKLQTSPSLKRAGSFTKTSLISPRQTKTDAIHIPVGRNHQWTTASKSEVVARIIEPPQKERPALLVSSSIKMNTPVELVYDQWLNFGEVPHFMCGATRGGRFGDSRMVWRIGWTEGCSQWEAEVCEQIPCIRIAWSNEHGRPCAHSGSVSFCPVAESVSRITVSLEFALEDPFGKNALAVETLASRVEQHLKCFQARGAAHNCASPKPTHEMNN